MAQLSERQSYALPQSPQGFLEVAPHTLPVIIPDGIGNGIIRPLNEPRPVSTPPSDTIEKATTYHRIPVRDRLPRQLFTVGQMIMDSVILEPLSPTQRAVLSTVVEESHLKPNELADLHFISPKTAKNHLADIRVGMGHLLYHRPPIKQEHLVHALMGLLGTEFNMSDAEINGHLAKVPSMEERLANFDISAYPCESEAIMIWLRAVENGNDAAARAKFISPKTGKNLCASAYGRLSEPNPTIYSTYMLYRAAGILPGPVLPNRRPTNTKQAPSFVTTTLSPTTYKGPKTVIRTRRKVHELFR